MHTQLIAAALDIAPEPVILFPAATWREYLIQAAYIAASVLFILGLKGLTTPDKARRAFDLADIKHWMKVFLTRFFEQSQFKRSALPNGPKISSGGSLSPRGDWRAPSDSHAATWLAELERGVPDA